MRLRSLLYVALLSFLGSAHSAFADDIITYTITGAGINGIVYAQGSPDSTIPGAFDIYSISGEINGTNISIATPLGSYNPNDLTDTQSFTDSDGRSSNFAYDDLSYTSGTFLDLGGLLFLYNGQYANLYSSGGADYFLTEAQVMANQSTLGSPLGVTETIAPTPEPSSLILLGTGVLGLAGAARRRLAANR